MKNLNKRNNMGTSLIVLIVLLALTLLAALFIVGTYNKLIVSVKPT